jgi:hypothetical protein
MPLLADEQPTQHADAGVVSDARARQRRRHGIAAAVIGIALAGGLAAAIVGNWESGPSTRGAHEAQLVLTARAAENVCRSRLRVPPQRIGGAGAWRTVLVERHAPATIALFDATGGGAAFTCLVGRLPTSGVMGGVSGALARPLAVGLLVVGSGSGRLLPKEGSTQYSWIEGRTGAGVTGVTVRFATGESIVARSADGWFLASWRGRRPLARTNAITATTSRGG